MKKLLSLFLAFSVSATLLSCLTSCAQKPDTGNTDTGNTESVETTESSTSSDLPDSPDLPDYPDISADFYIQVNEGWCALGSCKNSAWNENTLTIPPYYQGYPLQMISVAALRDLTSLETVILPDTMRVICKNAFRGSDNIKYNAYGGALYLGTETNPYFALICAENTEITSCEFHPDTKIVAQNAFEDCVSLKNVTLSDGLISMGENAFLNCDQIQYTEYNGSFYLGSATNPYFSLIKRKNFTTKKCVLHADVKRIESGAFADLDIISITFPQGLSYISTNAFSSTSGNFDVTLPDGVLVESKAFYFARINSLTIHQGAEFQSHAFQSAYVKTVTFKNGCTKVAPGIFYGCFSLTSVHLPESMTHIGNAAFRQCIALKNINIPSKLTHLGKEAFMGCSAIASVTLPDTLKEIGNYAFSGCEGLTSVYLPSNITDIGEHAFSYCDQLKSVVIDSHITVLPSNIFFNSTELETVQLPGTLKKIDSHAFKECKSLKIITIPEGVTEIGKGAFYNCIRMKIVNLPRSLTKIDAGAFSCGSVVFSATITYPGTEKEFARIQKISTSSSTKDYYLNNVVCNTAPITLP